MADPRLYQIAVLASLLVYGMAGLDFEITITRAALLLLTVLATQAVGDRIEGRPPNLRSALISGLSFCLLLRTNRADLAFLAAVITIAAKFVFRFRGKHIFNPTNGGIVAMLLMTSQVVGLARPMGIGRVLRVPDGVPRRRRRQPRGA